LIFGAGCQRSSKHFQILTERGFIEPMKKGAFSLKERVTPLNGA